MLIYDFDQTIKSGEEAGQAFFEASRAQQDLVVHPEHFDSLRNKIIWRTWKIIATSAWK